jgi:diguanylate cyclase (GGDEF)-like protein/PAS domain S-box-containing protein
MSTASSSPPALLAGLAVLGLIALAVAAVSARRLGPGRAAWAWAAWALAFGLFAAGTATAAATGGPGSETASGLLLAGYAVVTAAGIVLRLPAGAVAVRHLALDATPLVLAVVSVASVTYGGLIDPSAADIVDHLVVPAAFTLLGVICLHAIRYVGRTGATRTARLMGDGFLLTALAGASPAFVSDGHEFATYAAVVWAIGMGGVLAGALLRASAPAGNPTYVQRQDPVDGWSWAAMLGVSVPVIVAVAHHGPGDGLRAAAAVVAFAAFAVRSTVVRREGARLMTDLRDAERRFRMLVEQIPIAIYTDAVDATSSTQYVSPAIEPLLGYTPEELKNDPEWFPMVLHPEDRDRVLAAMLEWHGTDLPWAEEFRMIAKDGAVHWVRDEARVIRDESGAPLYAQGFLQDVTEQRLSEQAYRDGEARKAAILDAAFDCIVTTDDRGRIVEWNAAAERTFGYAREDALGREVAGLIVPEAAREAHRAGLRRGSVTRLGTPTETTALRADGSEFPVEIVIARADAGEAVMFTASIRDVTERKRAERDLRESERRYRETLDNVNLLALSLDTDGLITYCNDHVCTVTGWSREELVGRSWYETFGPIEREAGFLQEISSDALEDGSEEEIRARDGARRMILWWDSVSRDEGGQIIGVNSIGQDVTERREAEARLAFLRDHDELTELPNRHAFSTRLEAAIADAREHGRAAAVVFISLERFHVVNDAYGHAVGDAVLRGIAGRLGEATRGAAFFARAGGDEFAVLIAGGREAGDEHAEPADVAQIAAALAGRVRHVLRRPFSHDGHEVYLTARTGAAVYPLDADGADDLMKAAHVEAYRADDSAHNSARRGSAAGLAPRDELELVARMHRAIEQREFLLHYQPVVELASGAVTGAEALIRWQPAGEELVPPMQFIPVAERTGLIGPITAWVVDEAAAQTVRWREAGIQLDVAFNFPVGLWDTATLANILGVIRGHGLDPGALVVEVTESAAVTDAERSSEVLDFVRASGIRLAIDDFGTGYSSLARLVELPAAVVKVDRSFVRRLPHDPGAAAVTNAVIQLARNLGMRALAEGIETDAQRRFLAELGCTHGQGYLFSRPVPAADITAMLTRRAA